MNLTIKAGLLLGVLCSIWELIMGLTGWYVHPVLLNLFWVVILIQIGVLVGALNKTAVVNSYWQQVGKGTLISFVGAVIIFIFSLIFTSVLFPNYFNDLQAMQEQLLREAGTSEAEITRQLNISSAMQTSFVQAISGFLGTIFTGFIISLIVAAFKKKKL